MSLLSTLAKVAVGVVIAKGVGNMMQNAGSAPSGGTGTPGSGGLFGGPNSTGRRTSQAPGDLQDMMKDILAGKPGQKTADSHVDTASSGGEMGGLGGLLEQLAGGGDQAVPASGKKGGLDDLLGQLSTGRGGFGDLLGGAAAGRTVARSTVPGVKKKEFGELLNQSVRNFGEPDAQPTSDQEAFAALMLRAMIQAAKSDGKIDEAEKKKLLGSMGEITDEDMAFLKAELAAPVDVEKLVKQVPRGLGPQVYSVSVMATTLDNQNEANYLDELARGLGIAPAEVNKMHSKLGVPALYG
ncbi:DUF533 domain-containing protein [Tabrizicola sp. BL-A-41-H6]|uniref:DUF533 domain-containing protein n=1 Tax=Tabrizicola sp. BL-A-41-H6 TaxID=3421107 RepID=UPI003D6740F1